MPRLIMLSPPRTDAGRNGADEGVRAAAAEAVGVTKAAVAGRRALVRMIERRRRIMLSKRNRFVQFVMKEERDMLALNLAQVDDDSFVACAGCCHRIKEFPTESTMHTLVGIIASSMHTNIYST